jgi:hypothetical protein
MLLNKFISILHKPKVIQEVDYCLEFSGEGYIEIDELKQFLDHNEDFYFEMQFKINTFPHSGFNYLMNSCCNTESNKVGIAVDGTNIYVQVDKGIGGKTELYINFSDTSSWHTITVTNDRGSLSASLDEEPLSTNEEPSLSLPSTLGFKIASDTARLNGLSGRVDNILLTDLSEPIAQYLLNTGSGTTAFDSVGSYNGSITNGEWQLQE